jgi:lipopolysaccharide export system protein LptA/lipopolysaccharide export system protein LptC
MRRSRAARYARWSALAALLLAATVAGVYGYYAWRAAEQRRQLPPTPPPTVRQQAAEFSFSRLEGGRKLFTVRASRTTEFARDSLNRLEDVRITLFGRRGDRFDRIRTRQCDYDAAAGRITCGGAVQLALAAAPVGSAPDDDWTEITPAPDIVLVETAQVTFENATGVVHTDQPVEFTFPGGTGRAVGISYDSRAGIARLHGAVFLRVGPGSPAGTAPVGLSGTRLEFRRDDHTLQLAGPVRAHQAGREFAAGTLRFKLDPSFRVRRARASGQPQLVVRAPDGLQILRATEFSVELQATGGLERFVADGHVELQAEGPARREALSAGRLVAEFAPGDLWPRELHVFGSVRVQSRREGQMLELTATELHARRARESRDRIELAEAEAAGGVLTWLAGDGEHLRLSGRRLQAQFDRGNRLREMTGAGEIELRRTVAGRPEQSSRSHTFALRFAQEGGWSELEQSGDVHYRDGERTAQAERARFLRAEDALQLRGGVVLREGALRTTADSVDVWLGRGELEAEGAVRTSFLEGSAGPDFASTPAHVAAERLHLRRDLGRAVFSGGVRLWQGTAMIEAAQMEFDRAAGRLLAETAVRALVVEAAATPPRPWRVVADWLEYRSAEGVLRLQRGVQAESADIRLRAPQLALYTTDEAGARRVLRAEASGGVLVQQGRRHATAEHAEYFAREEKFVLRGGTSALHDDLGNSVSGAELTFYRASDTILVKSEEGSRTLTRYRVER